MKTYRPDNVLTDIVLQALLAGAFPFKVNWALRRYLRYKNRRFTIFSLFPVASSSGPSVFFLSWLSILFVVGGAFILLGFLLDLTLIQERLNIWVCLFAPAIPAVIPYILWKRRAHSLERRKDLLGISLCSALIALDPRFRLECEPDPWLGISASKKVLRQLDNGTGPKVSLSFASLDGIPDSPYFRTIANWFTLQDGLEELEQEEGIVEDLIEDSTAQSSLGSR